MKLAMALATAVALAAPAMAQDTTADSTSEFRVGVGYANLKADDVKLGGATVRGTYLMNPYFGFEGEVIAGTNDDEVAGVNLDLDGSFGGFVVGQVPVSSNFELFGRLGYAKAEISATTAIGSTSVDSKGGAYGVGANVFFGGNWGARLDYTQYEGGDDLEESVDVWSVSAVLRF